MFITPMVPDESAPGAIPRLLIAQLRGIAALHEVTVITLVGAEPGAMAAVDALHAEGLRVRAVVRPPAVGMQRWRRRVRLGNAWMVRRWPWRSAWYFEPSLGAALGCALSEGGVDIVHAEDNATGMYSFPPSVPAVLTEHEVRRPRPFALPHPRISDVGPAVMREIDWHRWRRYQATTWSRFRRIIFFTDEDAASASEISPMLAHRFRVSPFAVTMPPRCDPRREEAGVMLFAGNFSHPPNVDAAHWLAREIVPSLRREVPHARLLIVGTEMPASVRAIATPGVTLLGEVPDMTDVLNRAQVVVAPVRLGGGMRMKVLEGMAAGKPVVTTPRGARGLGANPPLWVADSTAGIVGAISELLREPARRHEFATRGCDYVRMRHGPEAVARRLDEVYHELVPPRGGRDAASA